MFGSSRMEIISATLLLALPVAALFFWGRGILKSRKDDIVLGFSLLALVCLGSVVFSTRSAVFSGLGLVLFIFGVETLIVNAFAKDDCPLSRKERTGLGGLATLAIGALALAIV
jgi:hypothetical protein